MKKAKNWVLMGLAIIVALLGLAWIASLLLFFGFAIFERSEDLLQSHPTADSDYRIVVKYLAPFSAFGSHSITVEVYEQDQVRSRYETVLYNDGANLGDHNAQVYWLNATEAYLCLRGEEQDPEGLAIQLGKNVTIASNPAACTAIETP